MVEETKHGAAAANPVYGINQLYKIITLKLVSGPIASHRIRDIDATQDIAFLLTVDVKHTSAIAIMRFCDERLLYLAYNAGESDQDR